MDQLAKIKQRLLRIDETEKKWEENPHDPLSIDEHMSARLDVWVNAENDLRYLLNMLTSKKK